MKRRVVVTGIGPITSIGIGKRDFFDSLLACETNVKEIPAAYEVRCRFKSRYYTPFPDFRLPDEVETKYENVMEKTSQIAVAATAFPLVRGGDHQDYALQFTRDMTGEVTLRGRVLAIGGLKEKTMAALRSGVHTVIIPRDNVKDLDEIDQTVRAGLHFVPVDTVDQVFEAALAAPRGEHAAPRHRASPEAPAALPV